MSATNSRKISELHYDHLQLYVDKLEPIEHYKGIENRLNRFVDFTKSKGIDMSMKSSACGTGRDVTAARQVWTSMVEQESKDSGDNQGGYTVADPTKFVPHGRDLVAQLLYGFGWRVTGSHEGDGTQTLLVTTNDPTGVKFAITAKAVSSDGSSSGTASPAVKHDHFAAHHLDRYLQYHGGSQGIAVLGFNVQQAGEFSRIVENYKAKHPALVLPGSPRSYKVGGGGASNGTEVNLTVNVLEVFAYYAGKATGDADTGTVIRFIERTVDDGRGAAPLAEGAGLMPLPGLVPVEARFDGTGSSAYCDHWVSNVIDREKFLQTLEDTLGFAPKVDFNAGVVAAGEAQIESTVTGNDSSLVTNSYAEALKDQGQVFLPINNALSPVGHVHWYLEQLGQGIQHVASRVQSLPDYVQRANDYREITGEGFTFLNIPRTYYGLLDQSSFKTGGEAGEFLDHSPPKKNKRERERERNDAKAASSPTTGGDSFDEVQSAVSANQEAQLTATGALSDAEAHATRLALQDAGIVDDTGAVSLSVTDEAVMEAIEDVDLGKSISALAARKKKRVVCKCVKRSIYGNLWKLLKDQISEETYMMIVRNKILIDVQGEDVLMQIFTGLVLQREPGREAPFLEFIQRLCADGKRSEDEPEKKKFKSVDAASEAGAVFTASSQPKTQSNTPIKPGCGGFGIRNFLTLFLSIEVSKAMMGVRTAKADGDEAQAAFHQGSVDLFTMQLVEANPILNEISDSMTAEGEAVAVNDVSAQLKHAKRKEAANAKLQACAAKYNSLMKEHREARAATQSAAAFANAT